MAAMFDQLVGHRIERDIYRNKWKRRLKKRNTMNQRAVILLNKAIKTI